MIYVINYKVLDYNDIDTEGAKKIVLALKRNNTLAYLDLGKGYKNCIGANDIGIEGAKEITTLIKTNNTLTTLNIGK